MALAENVREEDFQMEWSKCVLVRGRRRRQALSWQRGWTYFHCNDAEVVDGVLRCA
jgi:hypothetical protein